MLYVFCVEWCDKMPINKRYNAYSVVLANGNQPRVDFAFARQPWPVKRTTLTALHHESVYIAKFIHLNNGATPTTLRSYNIHHGGYIHWNSAPFCHLFIRILLSIVLQNARFNAVGVALLIAQGCQTIVQATLGSCMLCVEQRRRCCAFSALSAIKYFIITMPSQKKLNTYGVESPCERLPGVGSSHDHLTHFSA